jgi:hypothetical protein
MRVYLPRGMIEIVEIRERGELRSRGNQLKNLLSIFERGSGLMTFLMPFSRTTFLSLKHLPWVMMIFHLSLHRSPYPHPGNLPLWEPADVPRALKHFPSSQGGQHIALGTALIHQSLRQMNLHYARTLVPIALHHVLEGSCFDVTVPSQVSLTVLEQTPRAVSKTRVPPMVHLLYHSHELCQANVINVYAHQLSPLPVGETAGIYERPRFVRGRFQSDVEGSSARRSPRPSSYDELAVQPVRSRFESMINLGVASGTASASDLLSRDSMDGRPIRMTLVVREEGKLPTHFVSGMFS